MIVGHYFWRGREVLSQSMKRRLTEQNADWHHGITRICLKKRVFRTSGIRFLTTFNTLAVGERCPVVSFVGKCCVVITGIWKIKEFSKWLQLIAKGTREFLQTFHLNCEPRGGTGWIIRRWSGLLGHVVGETWISATGFHVRNSVQQLPGLIRVERSGIPREIHG